MKRFSLIALLVLAGAFWWTLGVKPVSHRPLPSTTAKLPFFDNTSRRAMLALGSAPRPNVLHRRDWYAVWIYTPLAQPRVVWHQSADQSVLHQARQSTARETAVINGGYFVPRPGRSRPFIGDVSTGKQQWQRGAGQTSQRRWVVGWQLQNGQAPRFGLELMEEDALYGFAPSPSFQRRFSHGMSGLLCLMRDGEAQVWRDETKRLHIAPPGQWKGLENSFGPYFRHAAMGWSKDGKHLFFVVQHNPRGVDEVRDLFGHYENQTYKSEGALLPALRHAFGQLPQNQRPCAPDELPKRIENAVLLDGGHCSSLIYRRRDGKRVIDSGSWLHGVPGALKASRVPTMIEVTKP